MNNNSLRKKLNMPHMLVAFAITAVLYVIMIILCHITPFGNRTWLMYDMKLQYVDYYAFAKNIVSGESNAFYSFSTTLGSGTIGLFTYFMTSPFVYISALFPNYYMPTVITVIIGLEMALASMTMDIFLQKFCDKSAYLCSVSYGFCGYIIANAMNIMWLDVIVLLPIVILMTEYLIREGKLVGYILSIAAILVLNYYISYMVLIFICIWSLGRLFVLIEKNPSQVFMRLGMSTVAAVATVAALIIPTFLELRNNQITTRLNDVVNTIRAINFKQVISKLYSLTSDSTEMYWGAPMIFCGLAIVVLVLFYIVDGMISWRERLAMITLSGFMIASFIVDRINLLWHVGVQHSEFPYREAVFLSFILITCACNELNAMRRGLSIRAILSTIAFLILLTVYILNNPSNRMDDWKISFNQLLLLVLMLLIIGYGHTKNGFIKMVVAILLVLCQFVDLGINGVYIYRSEAINAESLVTYQAVISEIEPTVSVVKNNDSSFYRMDNWSPRGLNDGMIFGYNSVTNYSLSSLPYTRDFLQRLGYDYDTTYLDYGHDNTETADSILGIKYVLTDSSHAARMHKEYTLAVDGKTQAYLNPYALPVCVGVYREMSGEAYDPFSFQEEIYTRLTGEMTSIFVPAKVDMSETPGSRFRQDYMVTASKSGEMYFYMSDIIDDLVNMEVYIDEEFVTYYGNAACHKVLNLGYIEEGETMWVTVVADDEDEFGTALFMTEDTTALADAYNSVRMRFADVRAESASYIRMTLDSSYTVGDAISGQVGIFTTIPYEKGWKARVAGVKVKPIEVYDSLMYIPVTEAIQQMELAPGEDLTVELRYIPDGFIFGLSVTCFTILMMILIAFLRRSESSYFIYDEDDEYENKFNTEK